MWWRWLKSSTARRKSRPADRETLDALATETFEIDARRLRQYRHAIIRSGDKYRSAVIITPRRLVGLSLLVFVLALASLVAYVSVRAYRHQDYSIFMVNVTRVVPIPAARVGLTFISYHDYLSELRRYTHYFEVQQQDVDLSSPEQADFLSDLKHRALHHVVNQVYVDKLAGAHQIEVTDEEIETKFDLLRQQNKLGGNEAETAAVLGEFFGLSIDEYLGRIKDELLRQKVVAKLDARKAQEKAEAIHRQAAEGADFAALARDNSDDIRSAAIGGEYNFWLDLNEQNEAPEVLAAVFTTEVGGVSSIVQTGYRLEIIKVLEENSVGQRRAAHISVYFSSEVEVLKTIKDEQPTVYYLQID